MGPSTTMAASLRATAPVRAYAPLTPGLALRTRFRKAGADVQVVVAAHGSVSLRRVDGAIIPDLFLLFLFFAA